MGTVSNYFNRPEKVSDERRRRVATAVDELGFVPNALARAFARGDRLVVGLVILDFNNPFFSEAARGLVVNAGNANVFTGRAGGVA